MKPRAAWEVTRTAGTVRIDVNGAEDLTETDRNAMIAAAEELLMDPDISLVQLDGPALDKDASQGLAEAVASLERLAARYEKTFLLAPI